MTIEDILVALYRWEALGGILVIITVVGAATNNPVSKYLWRRVKAGIDAKPRKSRIPANWDRKIEALVEDVAILGVTTQEPILELEGDVILTDGQRRAAEALRATLDINDPHAMLVEDPQAIHQPMQLRARRLDYAALQVLREERKAGTLAHLDLVVSACAVIVCPEKRMLVLHHRARTSYSFPGCLHTIGGAYQPPWHGRGTDDDRSLRAAAIREALEETKMAVGWNRNTPFLLACEVSTRFFQFVILGAEISAEQFEAKKANWEGAIVPIPFDGLREALEKPAVGWVPSGKAHILAWLAHGAPGAGKSPRFSKLSPESLFEAVTTGAA